MSEWVELAVGTLAVWRITHLVQAEDGPADALARLRRWLGDSLAGRALGCFYCLSVWFAAALAIYLRWGRPAWFDTVLWCAALSGGACLLERVTGDLGTPPVRVQYYEGKGEGS